MAQNAQNNDDSVPTASIEPEVSVSSDSEQDNAAVDVLEGRASSEGPRTPRHKRLTRDQRRDIVLMRGLEYSYAAIAKHLGVTERAVQYALTTERPTPQHRKAGRKPKLNELQVDALVDFVTSSRRTRRMPYKDVAKELYPDGSIGVDAIKKALLKRGYRRYVALRKPPLSPKNVANRLKWAEEHVNWTREQWNNIIWSDETWVVGQRHRKTRITRQPGEEILTDCIVERIRHLKGWMFWGAFCGDDKGPSLVWDKAWGSINATTYQEHTVPIIDGYVRLLKLQGKDDVQFMQDGAPGHSASETRQLLQSLGIILIFWPAFSPDLNPIETLWGLMKDWIDKHYPEPTANYDYIHERVIAAWAAIGSETLNSILDTMKERCEDVIRVKGSHTRW